MVVLCTVDGIALTPDGNTLLYCPLTSHQLYSISTQLLRDFDVRLDKIKANVQHILDKQSSSDGLAYSNNGNDKLSFFVECCCFSKKKIYKEGVTQGVLKSKGLFYFTSLENSGIWEVNFTNPIAVRPLVANTTTMIWPDTIGMSEPTLVLELSFKPFF
jgi:hypothetical protein